MALWVACGHAFQDFIHVVNHNSGCTNFLSQPFYQQGFFAHFAVDTFIVISGFCLMLPVARNNGFTLSGGWVRYLRRRSLRILPPYYAALLLAVGMSGLRYWVTAPNWESHVIRSMDFRPSALLAHVFLIQNMWNPWARALDGPTWSVATEFQIYILFPLILLPLWRRLKPPLVIAMASALGVAIFFATKSGLTSCSWYVGLFAMGMFAAETYVRRNNDRIRPALLAVSVVAATTAIVAMAVFNWMPRFMWALDLIVGIGVASTLVHLASYTKTKERNLGLEVLEWRPLVALGTVSYSFYLIHAPILNVLETLLLIFRVSDGHAALLIVATLAAIILFASGFYKFIELPCMPKRS
jgi:peptidoglycan/LPS O-acetylase OafA/YrhL